jgi:hypothetical protein
MKTVIVETNQNILDICLQEYGSLDNLVDLHEANGLSEIPADIVPGDTINIPDLPKNDAIVTVLQNQKPATHNEKVFKEITKEGIGYWQIGVDFIVS